MSILPAHVLAVGVLVWDEGARLLLVRTHDRTSWVLPGGIVEADESPASAGRREVAEELGLDVTVGRLLAVQHQAPRTDRPSNVQLVFDSAPLSIGTRLVLQTEEIAEARWLAPDDAVRLMSTAGQQRLRAALAARDGGHVRFLEMP